jgi:ribosome-binding protein aMBF1 (putative translation factor)
MSISAAQVKQARRLVGWSQKELSIEARVDPSTVSKFERGTASPGPRITSSIRRALEEAGIEFTDGEAGVKLKKAR